jgi:hypothetical protein
VRYAFAKIPAAIGKVFFSKGVALPFIKFRQLRHGFLRSPIYWKEIDRSGLKGIYAIHDETRRPDIVVYYCHGGGFSMGSAYFYLEFLLVWVSLLKDAGYDNPALFALDYTLVPEATYPTQVQQALAGYKYVLSIVDDPSQICVSGDSAGATLILSLLFCLSDYTSLRNSLGRYNILQKPEYSFGLSKCRESPSLRQPVHRNKGIRGRFFGLSRSVQRSQLVAKSLTDSGLVLHIRCRGGVCSRDEKCHQRFKEGRC